MPKARKRKKSTTKKHSAHTQNGKIETRASTATLNGAAPVSNRRFTSPQVSGPLNLIMPMMVALGCWGFAFFFLFMYADPNHVLYGGMAIVMALLWTFSVAMRVRKLRLLRQRATQVKNA
jgi:hypothetical protein